MRLVELLVVLIVEGRKALPKSPLSVLAAKRMESFPGDRSHRQVIEAIRAGNNDEFFESMESGAFQCVPAPSLLLTRRCYDAETSAILLLLKRVFT